MNEDRILLYKRIAMFGVLVMWLVAEGMLHDYLINMVINHLPIVLQLKFLFSMLDYFATTAVFLYWCNKTRIQHKSYEDIFYGKILHKK